MKCPYCGRQNDQDAVFCIFCSSDLSHSSQFKKKWTVGGAADNDFVEDFPMVSGHHCEIYYDGEQLSILDRESTNGTWVNGRRIPPFQRAIIRPGDVISLGSHPLPDRILYTILDSARGSQTLSVGRGPENDIILDFPQISYHHAYIIKDQGRWFIQDRGSTNGTYVNDRSRPVSRCEFTPDDILFFGSYRIAAARLLTMKKDTALGRSDPCGITITKAETVFGRDPSADIVLDYPQISWRHARLVHTADGFVLEDLGSTNGTFVNGQKITAATPVSPSDSISFGSFVFRLTPDLKQLVKRDYRGDIRIDADEITVQVFDKKKKEKKTLLDRISLSIFPSEFVGLMGPSGAGKTTLLLALNGYLIPQSGCSVINGQSLYDNYDAFRKNIGYVPQEDIMHPELTVYEALYYTAKLRLPSDYSDSEISARIDKVLAQLGLSGDTKNVMIGSAEKKGISGGQRKRVNLAMELLTDPSLLFLDEPTSGLSSQDTLIVMDVLRKLADSGKTIILTIHQPSLEAYRKMDNIIILAYGKLMYYGPAYPDSLTFFNPDLSHEKALSSADNALKGLARQLDVSGIQSEDERKQVLIKKLADREAAYRKSNYYKSYVTERKGKDCPISNVKSHRRPSESSGFRQWWTLTQRYFTVKRKDILNTAILFLQAPFVALLIWLVFQGANDSSPSQFLLVVSAFWFGISNSAREIVAEKAIYQRERMVNLKIPSYIFSKYTVLGILCLIQCLILVGVLHPGLEYKGSFIQIVGVVFLSSLVGLSIGMLISSLTGTQQQAIGILPLVLIPVVILGGGMRSINDMPDEARILSYIAPSRWAYEQIIHVEQDGVDEQKETDLSLMLKQDKIEYLFGEYKQKDEVLMGIMVGFVVGFIVLTMIALKQKDQV